jgi:hypothetical protein
MARHTLADYTVIHAGAFLLSRRVDSDGVNRRHKDFNLKLPDNRVLGEDKAQLIIQYEIRPEVVSRMETFMNDRRLARETYQQSHTRMGQIIFPFSAAVPERCIKPSYPLRFAAEDGRFWLKDVVIWYQLYLED